MGSTRRKRLAAAGIAGIALISGGLLAISGGAQATTSTTCATHDDVWPAWVQGMPTGINPSTASGVYMWHDGNGWHIRVTHHTDSLRTFSGQLITGGTFANVTAVKL